MLMPTNATDRASSTSRSPTLSTEIHVAYSRPGPGDKIGADYDSEGRVDGTLLAGLVKNVDAHYFLCGPTRFMADVQADLERRHVPVDQIHTETFGPTG